MVLLIVFGVLFIVIGQIVANRSYGSNGLAAVTALALSLALVRVWFVRSDLASQIEKYGNYCNKCVALGRGGCQGCEMGWVGHGIETIFLGAVVAIFCLSAFVIAALHARK